MLVTRTYVPPRSAWAAPPPVPEHGPVSPIDTSIPMATMNGPRSPIHASPLPSPRHHRSGSDAYYEDVDPRFAQDPDPVPTITYDSGSPSRHSAVPNSLLPGSQAHLGADDLHSTGAGSATLDRDSSYENIAEGARSPAGSDASHFTSISQRGVNPNWRPGPAGPGGPGSAYGAGGNGTGVATQRRNERNDMILGGNPDFSIPGMAAPRGGYRGAPQYRGGRGGAPPNMGGMRAGPGIGGLTPQGRYPTDI